MPLTARGFAAALDRLGPFEPAPHLAVAVSGGADSMALSLLADRWARDRGGRITAITVDHGLRAESRAEAAFARRTLAAAGIRHVTLRWSGDKPASGIQATAREARYRLLEGWCRDHGVLHLLVAHHLGDQAETVAMRRAMRSGADGLAGMAAIAWRRHVRLLRPLLETAPEALRDLLRRRGVDWIEDPSNRDERFARVRARLAITPASRRRLAAAAARAGGARAARDAACARLLATGAAVYPDGHGRLDAAVLGARASLSRAALARMIACIGGQAYLPRRDALARALAALRAGRSATLGGCRLIARAQEVLVVRELRNVAAPVSLAPGEEALWDGRFRAAAARRGTSVRVGAAPDRFAGRASAMSQAVAASRPAILACDTPMTDPALLTGRNPLETASFPGVRIAFAPQRSLCAAPFPVV